MRYIEKKIDEYLSLKIYSMWSVWSSQEPTTVLRCTIYYGPVRIQRCRSYYGGITFWHPSVWSEIVSVGKNGSRPPFSASWAKKYWFANTSVSDSASGLVKTFCLNSLHLLTSASEQVTGFCQEHNPRTFWTLPEFIYF